MKIAVLGGDGYCGWATALHLSRQGHSVAIVDNFLRRQWDRDVGSGNADAIRTLADRHRSVESATRQPNRSLRGRRTDYGFLSSMFREFQPEALVAFCRTAAPRRIR